MPVNHSHISVDLEIITSTVPVDRFNNFPRNSAKWTATNLIDDRDSIFVR